MARPRRDIDPGRPDVGRPTQTVTGGVPAFTPTAPPPKKTGPPSANAALSALVKLKPFRAYRGNLGIIKQFAQRWSVDAVDLLLVLAATGRTPTADAIDPIAKRLRNSRAQYGSLDDWMAGVGIQAKFSTTQMLGRAKVQGYVPSYPQTPVQTAGKGVETSVARADITDPYVMVGKDGKIVPTKDPAKALKVFNAPVRMSDYQRAESHYNDYFTRYIGRKAKPGEIAGILNKGLSDYAVTVMLSKRPEFKRGLIWQSQAPSVIGYAKSMLGEGWKVDPDFVRTAIVQNWSEGTLRAKLRARPEYLKGPEFKQTVAQLTNVHQTIWGNMQGGGGLVGAKEAALGGWSADQYAAWLRGRPDYAQSSEYRSKALSFLDALGLITGALPTTNAIGQLGEPTQPKIAGSIPDSPRIAGSGQYGKVNPDQPKPGQPGWRPF